jgi:hypothetical protein
VEQANPDPDPDPDLDPDPDPDPDPPEPSGGITCSIFASIHETPPPDGKHAYDVDVLRMVSMWRYAYAAGGILHQLEVVEI